ncbi:heterokaryon incompatibility protein-domain-containing protein [Diaporthe sp. PMI_573]|nr:heterokaryon incompatibility protein-domain-containing protein [Diaporthaceae sp. PMI_573]
MTSLGLTIRQQFGLRNTGIVWRSLGEGGSAEESNYEVISVTMRRRADRTYTLCGACILRPGVSNVSLLLRSTVAKSDMQNILIMPDSTKELPIATADNEKDHDGAICLLTLVVFGDIGYGAICLLTLVVFGDIESKSWCADETERYDAQDEYIYRRDDAFLARLKAEILPNLTFNTEASSALCDRCLNINLEITLSSLLDHDPKDGCGLCQILSKCLNKDEVKDTKMQLLEARHYVRICAVLGNDSQKSKLIQPGLPVFLQSGSPSHFRLINEWLRLCADGKCSREGGCCPNPNGAQMPTRVIDVGIGRDRLRLISTDKLRQGIPYVALSHCWGKPTKEQKDEWCTTRSNEKERTRGFPVAGLPATFKDAIRVTQEIGKQYLWIDSLCILQGDDKDWEAEAKNMETVFRNSYCTIAATSAKASTEGFLNRPMEESNLQYVTVPKSSHGKVYVCTSIDDFPGDVEEGVLNKRAWVLQERALSRRTIHFTTSQTYFECGGGGLTKETDRPVAIDSLVMALADAFRTNVRYGIFERYLHRSLLWRRLQKITKERISDTAGQKVPSWSWMAYPGQVEYPEIGDVEWDESVQFVDGKATNETSNPENDGYLLKARVTRIQHCEIKSESLEHVIRNEKGDEVVHLWFDQEREASIEVRPGKRIMGESRDGFYRTGFHIV